MVCSVYIAFNSTNYSFYKKIWIMLIFYLLTLFAALPIFAYLLSQRTTNKGIVLGTTAFVLIGCLILFISKFAILGTVQKQTLSEQINNQIILMTVLSKALVLALQCSQTMTLNCSSSNSLLYTETTQPRNQTYRWVRLATDATLVYT